LLTLSLHDALPIYVSITSITFFFHDKNSSVNLSDSSRGRSNGTVMISFISAGDLLKIMILSDINKASSILCLINKIDYLYCVYILSNHFYISVRVNSSKAENGSSKQSISCGHIKARINDTRCLIPPESSCGKA